jgi:hypothetical protein
VIYDVKIHKGIRSKNIYNRHLIVATVGGVAADVVGVGRGVVVVSVRRGVVVQEVVGRVQQPFQVLESMLKISYFLKWSLNKKYNDNDISVIICNKMGKKSLWHAVYIHAHQY